MNYNTMGIAIKCIILAPELKCDSHLKGMISNEPDSDCEFELFLSSYKGNRKFDYTKYTHSPLCI